MRRRRDGRRYLPAVSGDGFSLAVGEALGPGLQRLSLEQLDHAISGLSDPTADEDRAIHEARKAMKRLRSLLRMVRYEIGDRAYSFENAALRDAARLVSGVRESTISVETVIRLAARFDGKLEVGALDDLAERLDRRSLRTRRRVLDESEAAATMLTDLRRARARFVAWPTSEAERKAYGGVAVRDRFEAVSPGIGETYVRGRREMRRAFDDPRVEHFHLWRKRARYLRHQMEVLTPIWPEVVGGLAFSLERLGDILGEEHDLAVVLRLLAVDPNLCPDPIERSLFAALAQHRRAELQAAARVLGTRVYAERTSEFVGRLGAYWTSVRFDAPLGLTRI